MKKIQFGTILNICPLVWLSSESLILDRLDLPSVALKELNDNQNRICVQSWTGGAWQQLGLDLNTDPQRAVSSVPVLQSDSSGKLLVAWYEEILANQFRLNIQHWNGSSWNGLGQIIHKSRDRMLQLSMAVNQFNQPVIAYQVENGYLKWQIVVMLWTGLEWQILGESKLESVPERSAYNASLKIGSDGQIVLAWQNYDLNFPSDQDDPIHRIYVKRWTGKNWEQVGDSWLNVETMQNATNPKLALDSNNNPVVAWTEDALPNTLRGGNVRIFMKRWTGTNWETIDTSQLEPHVGELNLCINKNNQPVIAWRSLQQGFVLCLAKYDGTNWQQLKNLNVNYFHQARDICLTLDSASNAVVAWKEWDGSSSLVYVKKFEI